jgi:hypothetical protein
MRSLRSLFLNSLNFAASMPNTARSTASPGVGVVCPGAVGSISDIGVRAA